MVDSPDNQSGSESSSAVMEPTRTSGRESVSSESLVTPEIQSAFEAVFGGGADADAPAERSPTRQRIDEAEERESLASLEDAEVDDYGEDFETEANADTDGDDADDDDALDEEVTRTDATARGKDADTTATLDPVLRHAAKRAGWSDKEISDFAASDPQLAERTFQKLHGSYNDLTSRYAQLGARSGNDNGNGHDPRRNPPPHEQQRQQEPDGDLLSEVYGEENLRKIAEDYDDEFVSRVLKPLMEPIREWKQMRQEREMELVGRQVNGFFGELPKEFQTLYGGKEISVEQQQHREHLAQFADQIMAGAAAQGVSLSVAEALDRANLSYAHEHLREIERKRIAQQVKHRSSSLTARPSQRRERASSTGRRSERSAIEAYTQRASELGYEVSGA